MRHFAPVRKCHHKLVGVLIKQGMIQIRKDKGKGRLFFPQMDICSFITSQAISLDKPPSNMLSLCVSEGVYTIFSYVAWQVVFLKLQHSLGYKGCLNAKL